MKLQVRIDGRQIAVEWNRSGERCVLRLDEGEPIEASVIETEPGVYSVLTSGGSYTGYAQREGDEIVVYLRGRRFAIEVADPRAFSGSKAIAGSDGRETLTAPMPGKLVRILSAVGDLVEPGQSLVVIEAMKMQSELKTRRGGTVSSLPVAEGATVGAGEVLAIVE